METSARLARFMKEIKKLQYQIETHLFFDHSELLVDGLEVEPVEAGPVVQVLEIPEADVADALVDGRHEGGHRPVGEVQDLRHLGQEGAR